MGRPVRVLTSRPRNNRTPPGGLSTAGRERRTNFKYRIALMYCTVAWNGARCSSVVRERERNVLFNDALNTFYLQLYGVRHMVKDHSDRRLFPINSKGSFICTIPQTG